MPALFLAISGGNLSIQLLGQAFLGVLSGAFIAFRHLTGPTRVSIQSKVILSLLWVATILIFAKESGNLSELDVSQSLAKLTAFSIIIIAFDLQRNRSYLDCLRNMLLPALGIVALFWLSIVSGADTHFGRLLFFGLHPNLGGEVLIVCFIIMVLVKNMWLRMSFVSAILIALFLLQSRSALVAAIMILFAAEYYLHRSIHIPRASWLFWAAFLLFISILGILLLLVTDLGQELFRFFWEDVLLLNDPNRGLGTGLVGRSDSFETFVRIFSESPFLGVGLDQVSWTGTTIDKDRIHNGILVLPAEFGVFGIGVLLILAVRLVLDARKDPFLFWVRLSLLFMFFLSARSVNLGIFPLILWVLFLPWLLPTRHKLALPFTIERLRQV